MTTKKQILDRGYVTHALTNEKGEIYGMNETQIISWEINEIEKAHTFYWSEVYCEPNYMAIVIRRGRLLVKPTANKLNELHEQSKINLHN